MYIRPATLNDLDALAEAHYTAFQDDPNVAYLFPDHQKFPELMNASTKERLRWFFAEPEMYLVMVTCSKANEDRTTVKPVAYAAWRLHDINPGEKYQSCRLNILYLRNCTANS
jgi:hypothetical protein